MSRDGLVPQALIAAGLLGMAGLRVAARFMDLAPLSGDVVRGACIGVEIIGLHLPCRARQNPHA